MNKLFADGVMVVTPQKQVMAAGSEFEDRRGEIQIDLKKDHHNAQTLSYFGLPYQDHNYGAPPPPTPPQSPPHCPIIETVVIVEPEKPPEEPKKEIQTSEEEREEEDDDEGEESNKDEGITRCICDFEHDDGYMICCDKCLVWQHVECMGLERSNIPDNYFCEKCEPRTVDVENAKSLQSKKKKHLEELQNREEAKHGKGLDLPGSLKLKKKVKKKKKKKEKEKDRDKEDDNKTDRKKEKKKKKKDRERGDSTSIDNQSDDSLSRTECVSNEKDDPKEISLIQCTPEVEKMIEEYRKNPEMFLAGAATYHGSTEDMKRTKVCVGQVSKGDVNGVVTLEQIPANQPIMQLSGTLSLKDNRRRHNSKQPEPFMFVYSSFCNTEMIINAGSHDNIARFTRKSCSPNAEIRHMIFDGEIHLYLFALKDIGSNSEVTIGLDFDFTVGPHPVKCACGKKSCPVKKFWHKQKTNGIKSNNGNIEAKLDSPKKKISPLKLHLNKQVSQESLQKNEEPITSKQVEIQVKSEPATPAGRGEEPDPSIDSKPIHKMTREERKMDAIMKAFERLEKSQQRRQQTLERLAQTKERQASGDSAEDQQRGKMDETESTKEKSEDTSKPNEDTSKPNEGEEEEQQEEEEEEKEDEMNEVNVTEQEEIQELVPPVENKPNKPRPQSRRKKKGASRKRSRNSSGASSVSIEVSSADDESNHTPRSSSQSPCPTTMNVPSSSTLLSVQTNFNQQQEASKDTAVSLTSPAADSKHFKFPKTKRFFMNEWLNEKAQEASADSPLTVKTENFDQVVLTLNSPSAAAVRDRSCSLDVGFGSAKKRWLRQAMQETSHVGGSSGSNSPVCNGGGGASPVTPSPAVSPNSNSMDFMTPLKKRMLRHSLAEERPSQYLSPKLLELSCDSSASLPPAAAAVEEEPLLTVKEEEEEKRDDSNEEESLLKCQSTSDHPASPHLLPLPARKEVRKNSSIDSGLSVTTPADFESTPSFPALNDNSSNELTTVRKLDLCKKDNIDVEKDVEEEKQQLEDVTPCEPPEVPKETSGSPEGKRDESPVKADVKPKQEEPVVVIPTTPSAPTVNPALKRCLSDEASFSNGEINPAYFSPKKRHLYLRQNTDPGSSERSLGGTWPRQELNKNSSLAKVSEEKSEALSQSWSGSSEKMASDQERTSAQVSGQPSEADVSSSDHHVTTPGPLVSPTNSHLSVPHPPSVHPTPSHGQPSPHLTPGHGHPPGPHLSPGRGQPPAPHLTPGHGHSPAPHLTPGHGQPPTSHLTPVRGHPPAPHLSPGRGQPAPHLTPVCGHPPALHLSPGHGHPPGLHLTPGHGHPPTPHLTPGRGHPLVTSPVPGTVSTDPRARIVSPVSPLVQVPEQRLVFIDPRSQLQDGKPVSDGVITPTVPYLAHLLPEDPAPVLLEEPSYLVPNAAGSINTPITPSKKKVSLLEYRKRKGSSATKKPAEKATAEEEESTEQVDPTTNPDNSLSPTSSSAESTPDKLSKPANIITFKDKKILDLASTITTEGLQSLPLFSKAPIAETLEGKKLSLTDEAHKLITSLTQVLMEGKNPKENSKMNEPSFGSEDPLQRMRRELNEKNKEKVLALKRAHSPEPPPPPPEKKKCLETGSPIPPPPPPRNIPPFGPGIHSPKAGGLQRQSNHVVVASPAVLAVQQVGPQTNGGHVVFSQVITGSTPPVAQYQQSIAKHHQGHSPRGQQNLYSPIAASTSPRGLLVAPHPNNFQFQHKNHVEEPLLPPVPNQMGQFYNGDRGGFHVNGDHHSNNRVAAAAAAVEAAHPSSHFPSNKFTPVHDKRSSSSYSRSSRALSPRRGYHRH